MDGRGGHDFLVPYCFAPFGDTFLTRAGRKLLFRTKIDWNMMDVTEWAEWSMESARCVCCGRFRCGSKPTKGRFLVRRVYDVYKWYIVLKFLKNWKRKGRPTWQRALTFWCAVLIYDRLDEGIASRFNTLYVFPSHRQFRFMMCWKAIFILLSNFNDYILLASSVQPPLGWWNWCFIGSRRMIAIKSELDFARYGRCDRKFDAFPVDSSYITVCDMEKDWPKITAFFKWTQNFNKHN